MKRGAIVMLVLLVGAFTLGSCGAESGGNSNTDRTISQSAPEDSSLSTSDMSEPYAYLLPVEAHWDLPDDAVQVELTLLEEQRVDLTKLSEHYSYYTDYDLASYTEWGFQMKPFTNTPEDLFQIDADKLNETDFEKYHLVLSMNRKIKEMYLFDFPEEIPPTDPDIPPPPEIPNSGPSVAVILSKEYYPDTIFVYRMDVVKVRLRVPETMYDMYTQVEQ